jgi:hypothetical protein
MRFLVDELPYGNCPCPLKQNCPIYNVDLFCPKGWDKNIWKQETNNSCECYWFKEVEVNI